MKLTKEDIKKYGSEDEKKLLEARRTEFGRKPIKTAEDMKKGRPTDARKLRQFQEYLEIEIDNIRLFHAHENWEDLAIELNDALADVKQIMKIEGLDWPL